MFCLILIDIIDTTTTSATSDPYRHQYTITFNTSGISQKEHHPNYAELFLHILTDHQNPAQVSIDNDHINQPIRWMQPSQASGKDDNKMPEVQLVRIALTSLTNSLLRQNDNMLTIKVASTNVIRIPSKRHYQTSLGLVLYMGGAPEAIDELLTTPIVAHHHMFTNKKKTQSIGGVTDQKRSTGSTPCQLKSGFKVKFSDVKGGFERILQPEMVDIGRCVGECPNLLTHLHNPSQNAEVRNLLVSRGEGSSGVDIATASCVPVTYKPLPVVLLNSATNSITVGTYNEMVATSCGCR